MTWPFPLGKVFPGVNHATASVPLTQNITPVHASDSTPVRYFNGLFIQADLNNGDIIYVCSNASAPDLTNYTNVLGEIVAGGSFPRAKEWANNRDISTLYIGAKNATDFVIVIIDQF
jgi:hypothetical protein